MPQQQDPTADLNRAAVVSDRESLEPMPANTFAQLVRTRLFESSHTYQLDVRALIEIVNTQTRALENYRGQYGIGAGWNALAQIDGYAYEIRDCFDELRQCLVELGNAEANVNRLAWKRNSNPIDREVVPNIEDANTASPSSDETAPDAELNDATTTSTIENTAEVNFAVTLAAQLERTVGDNVVDNPNISYEQSGDDEYISDSGDEGVLTPVSDLDEPVAITINSFRDETESGALSFVNVYEARGEEEEESDHVIDTLLEGDENGKRADLEEQQDSDEEPSHTSIGTSNLIAQAFDSTYIPFEMSPKDLVDFFPTLDKAKDFFTSHYRCYRHWIKTEISNHSSNDLFCTNKRIVLRANLGELAALYKSGLPSFDHILGPEELLSHLVCNIKLMDDLCQSMDSAMSKSHPRNEIRYLVRKFNSARKEAAGELEDTYWSAIKELDEMHQWTNELFSPQEGPSRVNNFESLAFAFQYLNRVEQHTRNLFCSGQSAIAAAQTPTEMYVASRDKVVAIENMIGWSCHYRHFMRDVEDGRFMWNATVYSVNYLGN